MHITLIPALVNSTNNFGRVAENRRVCLGLNEQSLNYKQFNLYATARIRTEYYIFHNTVLKRHWQQSKIFLISSAGILINKWNHIEAISLSFGTLPRIWKTMNDLMKLLSKSHLKESTSTKNNLIIEIYKNPLVLDNSYWSRKYNVMEISKHCADQWFFLLNSYLSASSNTTYSTDVSFKSISIITCRNRPGVATMLPIKESI